MALVTESNGALYQKSNCSGIQADREDDFKHGELVVVVAKIRQPCAKLLPIGKCFTFFPQEMCILAL